MSRSIDRLLAALAPKAEASAYCTPRSWYQYRCDRNKQQRRLVSVDYFCAYTYGGWTTVGTCP
jgi:hypothetical protein